MKGTTVIIIAVLVVGVAAVFLLNQMQIAPKMPSEPTGEKQLEELATQTEEKPSGESAAQTKQLREKLVPVTFKLTAPDAEQVILRFPVFTTIGDSRPRISMEKNGDFFEATVELPKDGIILYEYNPSGSFYKGFERLPGDLPTWRLVHVKEQLNITEEIYSWPKEPEFPFTISGTITDTNGEPVLDALVAIDGIIVYERGDGTFQLKVRPGRHQIIVFLLDGSYKTKSQFVDVINDTRLDFVLEKAKPLKVKINVDAELPEFHKLRMYSNSEQTGHRNLGGNWIETSTFLEFEKSIELDLYEGQYFEYLYSIGNLFNGFEHDGENRPVIRHFIAREGLIVNDVIRHIGNEDDISLSVKAKFADPYDMVGVEVEGLPGGAIPMHKKDGKEWVLKAIPETYKGSKYRYFRSMQESEYEKRKYRVLASNNNDFIDAWEFQSRELPQQSFEIPEIKNKFHIFVVFPDLYSPEIDMLILGQMERVAEKGHLGVVLSQIWSFSNYPEDPTLERSLYASDYDLKKLGNRAKSLGLKTALYPAMIGTAIASGQGDVPIEGPSNFSQEWWETHMDELERWNIYNARTAEAAGIDYLLIQPALPAYTAEGYNPEDYPNYNQRMKEIIKKMRKYYSGNLLAEIQGDEINHPFDYWMEADFVSARVNPPDYWEDINYETTQEEADRIMAEMVDKYKWASDLSGKPFIMQQFTPGPLEGFIDNPTKEQVENHWKRQRKIHEAIFKAINERPWVKGIWLAPYNFNDDIERVHVNIRGKPADELAAAWSRKISEKE
jgi:hypothetical protein